MTARRKAYVVQFAPLTDGRVDECRIEGRNFDPIVDDRAFCSPAAHIRDISISDFIPFERRTDQLDADLNRYRKICRTIPFE